MKLNNYSYKILGEDMRKLKYLVLIVMSIFSFYISDKLLLMVEGMSPLMQTINEVKDFKEYEPVDAVINGNTIIPGKKGRTINKRETYLKMNDFGTFNETFFVYDYHSPDVSLYDNLDKVIIKGNSDSDIYLIVDSDTFDDYLVENKINFTKLIKKENKIKKNDYISYINSNNEETEFYDLNYYLKRNKKNNKICLVGISNIKVCKELKYFLIEPNLNMFHSNVASVKSKLKGGDILYVHDNVSLAELKVIISEINYKGFRLANIKELIKE